MLARPVHPRGTAGGPYTPWLVLAAVWGVAATLWLSWAAGRIVAAFAGQRPGPDFGGRFVRGLVTGDWGSIWPGTSAAAVIAVSPSNQPRP